MSAFAACLGAAVVKKLKRATAEKAQQALGAIRSLSFDNASNISTLVRAGALMGTIPFIFFIWVIPVLFLVYEKNFYLSAISL